MLLIAAGGLGALLLVGMVGWAVLGRSPATVPVIEADARPLKVKPENPGGLQVVGADEPVGGAQTMAPAAEAPAPQALRAQLAPAAPRPAPAPVVHPPVVRLAMVQLAAVDTEAAGRTEWDRLAKKLPGLLSDKQPVMQRADKDGRTIWRVRTGFPDVAAATTFCQQLRAKGAACNLAS